MCGEVEVQHNGILRSDRVLAGKAKMNRTDDLNARLPIVPHETLGADCCGCLFIDLAGDLAKIVCNECGVVVRALPVGEVEAAMRELARTDTICTARCPHLRSHQYLPRILFDLRVYLPGVRRRRGCGSAGTVSAGNGRKATRSISLPRHKLGVL